MSEHDCVECRQYKRQIEAMEGKLRQQAQEWERITGELDSYREADARRRESYSARGRKRIASRWAKAKNT